MAFEGGFAYDKRIMAHISNGFRVAAMLAWLGVAGLLASSGGAGCDPSNPGGAGTTGGTAGGTGTAGTAGTATGGTTGGTAGTTGGTTAGTTGGTTGATTGSGALITFTPVGEALASDLIDLEFLPGQDGEAVVITKSGTVAYMRSDFTFLTDRPTVTVEDDDEQGLLNVAADPGYASNHLIYLFYTISDGDGTGPGNRVQPYTVTVDVAGDSFAISAQPVIVETLKNFPGTGGNHNGGSLVFDAAGNLYAGFGDGGGSQSGLDDDPAHTGDDVSQNPATNLGKIIRIADPATFPSASIFARGLRNPFTLAAGNGGIFIGDVGSGAYEEIDFAPTDALNVNFGWNDTEGPTSASGVTPPIHGYAHGDTTFVDADPLATGGGGDAIMAGAFYTGSQYGGILTNRFFYSEFYSGWVRSFGLTSPPITETSIVDDQQMGHNFGMTSLQQGPDGFLYGVSLFGDDHVLRVDLQ